MRNTDSESDADTESAVVDESADSVVLDTVQPGARLRTRSLLETCQTMLVEYGNQGGHCRRALNIVPISFLMSVGR